MRFRNRIFRPVPGYPGLLVSRDGIVLSVRPRRLKPHVSCGYLQVSDSANCKGIPYLKVHQAVLLAWVGPRPKGYVGCHNNGNRRDNRASNLRWATQKDNCRDIALAGTRKGSKQRTAKLTEADVAYARKLYRTHYLREISKLFPQVHPAVLRWAIRGHTWKHVKPQAPQKKPGPRSHLCSN